MRKLAGGIAETGTVVVLPQLREDPAVLFGDPERVQGPGPQHHAAVPQTDGCVSASRTPGK